MTSKFYAGYSLSPSVTAVLKEAFQDEYKLDIGELEELMKEKKFSHKMSKSYKKHLKNYMEAVKVIGKMKKIEKDGSASVIE
jgi:hypothetical protein